MKDACSVGTSNMELLVNGWVVVEAKWSREARGDSQWQGCLLDDENEGDHTGIPEDQQTLEGS